MSTLAGWIILLGIVIAYAVSIISTPYQKGHAAHFNGVLFKDNPYKPDSYAFKKWASGWDAAWRSSSV